MRNKHHRTSHKLGKRAFALCLALAVICSCLVPVFATGGIATMDGGFVMDEGFGVGGDDAGFAVDTQEVPASADDAATMEMPASSGDAATMDTPVVDTGDAASTSGPTITTKETEYGTVTEYDWGDSQTTWTGEDAIATPNDHMKEDDAAFGVLPIEYHFWLKQLDSFDFQMLAHEAEMAEMSETEYLALFGSSEQYPIWHMDTIASTDTISNYKFANPTAKDDPAGENHEFAYWYTVDENGVETEFDPYKTYGSETDTTVNIYAKWKDASGDVAQDTTKTEDTAKTESKTVEVSNKAKISDTEDEVTITVKGLPENVKSLSVTTMGEGSMNTFYELYAAQNGTMAPLFGFKIAPKDADGNTVQPKGPVTVTISGLSDEIMLSELAPFKVLHQVSATDIETINASYNSGTLTFATDSFSPFVIASKGGYDVAPLTITGTYRSVVKGKTITITSDNNNLQYQYVYDHSWSSSNTDIATVSSGWNGTQNATATVTGVKVGTVTITHTFSAWMSKDDQWGSYKITETFQVTVDDLSEEATGQWVYLYAHVSDECMKKLGLQETDKNFNGWFTLGKVWIPDLKNAGNEAYDNYVNHSRTELEKGVIKTLNDYLKKNDTTNVVRFEKNTSIDLSTVKWTYSNEYGLTRATGANDYIDGNYGLSTWHLDGYVDNLANLEVHYYDADTKLEIQTTLKEVATVGSTVLASTYSEKTPTIVVNGQQYKYYYTDTPSITIENGQTNIINLYYSKVVPTKTITVQKMVKGLLGEKDRDFEFSLTFSGVDTNDLSKVTVTKSDNTLISNWNSFTLKDGQYVTIENVPIGATLTVTEKAPGKHYKVTATGYENEISGENDVVYAYAIAEKTDEQAVTTSSESVNFTDDRIVVTNKADLIPDTGVLLDTLPYIVILAVVVGGGILLMLRKRRKNDD